MQEPQMNGDNLRKLALILLITTVTIIILSLPGCGIRGNITISEIIDGRIEKDGYAEICTQKFGVPRNGNIYINVNELTQFDVFNYSENLLTKVADDVMLDVIAKEEVNKHIMEDHYYPKIGIYTDDFNNTAYEDIYATPDEYDGSGHDKIIRFLSADTIEHDISRITIHDKTYIVFHAYESINYELGNDYGTTFVTLIEDKDDTARKTISYDNVDIKNITNFGAKESGLHTRNFNIQFGTIDMIVKHMILAGTAMVILSIIGAIVSACVKSKTMFVISCTFLTLGCVVDTVGVGILANMYSESASILNIAVILIIAGIAMLILSAIKKSKWICLVGCIVLILSLIVCGISLDKYVIMHYGTCID